MKREGILFQGLCIQESGNGFIQEEGVYYGEKVFFFQKGETHYVDCTYFLLYGIGKNRRCQELVQGMEDKWRNYLRGKAKKSRYQGEIFWNSLYGEEQECAQAALGLLEDIRAEESERAELAGLGSGIWFIRDFMRYTVFLKAVLKLHFKLFFGWQKRSIRNLLSASAIFAWNFCLQKS
mgnify:CR=1 FL=1